MVDTFWELCFPYDTTKDHSGLNMSQKTRAGNTDISTRITLYEYFKSKETKLSPIEVFLVPLNNEI